MKIQTKSQIKKPSVIIAPKLKKVREMLDKEGNIIQRIEQ